MANTYLTVYDYLNTPTGQQTVTLVGNTWRFAAQQNAGASSLSVPGSAVQQQINAYDTVYIFDGASSETVQASALVTQDSTAIPLVTPTQYQHNAGVACCTDGVGGSLAAQLFTASAWIEDICHQSLVVSTYSGEILSMPTLRASFDEQYILWFRPRHFPITALSAISIQTQPTNAVAYDPTQAGIDGDRQLVQISNLQPIPGNQQQAPYPFPPGSRPWSRNAKATLTITYSSGYSPIPYPVQRAAILLTNELLGLPSNPIGSDQINEGDRSVIFAIRGDTSGESALIKKARGLLQPYIVEES